MKKIKTRRFKKALYACLGASGAFLCWMLFFGKSLAVDHFDSITGCVFSVFALAAISFLAFCFFPYFHGDRRWFAIPSLLTVVFFVGAAMLWQVPMGGI